MATPAVDNADLNNGHQGDRPIPDKFGKYVIVNEVGRGSTGTVYLSHDPYYRRDVAIKVYDIGSSETEAERARTTRKMFFNEAHMVGMLQHPNILPIYDAGEENDKYYVVTEHIHGARTLASYCKPDRLLPVDDVIEIIYKVAKALHYAHGRGVIHRDIKPSNIMLTVDNDVRLIDFGIALIKDADVSRIEGIAGSPSYMSPEQVQSEELTNRSDLYSLGAVMYEMLTVDNDVRLIDFGIALIKDADVSRIEGIAGSPSYMSPEQVQSEELTNRSDLYSLGAVMYEMLTGFRPFRASNLSKLLHQIVFATPPPVHRYREDISDQLENIVAVLLQKAPEKRYANGLALAAELTHVYQDLRAKADQFDNQEQFDLLRQLSFFHDFSHSEIWEVLRAGELSEYETDDDIVREGEIDDRFYIIVSGDAGVIAAGRQVGSLGRGDCFGESSYLSEAKRNASIRATSPMKVLRVSSTLMEQVSSSCQLRFNKVFLRSLIERLQRAGGPQT
ncbi:MAG: protein kinase [Pseudomonadota bacterium]